VSADAEIRTLMGLTGATAVDVAKRIIKRNAYDGLLSGEKRLCIYFRPSRKARNIAVTEEVLQIDCHVPATEDNVAYKVMERVVALLHDKEMAKRSYFDGQLGDLPTAPSFFCVGARFCYYTGI
jgi:hypothetical protein